MCNEMFEEDVGARATKEAEEIPATETAPSDTPENSTVAELVNLMNSMKEEMGVQMKLIVEKFDGMVEKVDGIDNRVTSLEASLKELGTKSSKGGDSVVPTTESDEPDARGGKQGLLVAETQGMQKKREKRVRGQ